MTGCFKYVKLLKMKKYIYYFIISVFLILTILNSKMLRSISSNFYRTIFGRTSAFYVRSYTNSEIFFKDVDFSIDSSLVFITFGQSNSANSGKMEKSLKNWNDVYMSYKGNIYIYADPSIGAEGFGASVWGLLGKELLFESKGKIKNVFFTNTGVGGISIEGLISDENDFLNYFLNEFRYTMDRFGKIDGVLFHHGEANNRKIDQYYDSFITLQDSINSIKKVPIFLSQSSYCNSIVNINLLEIQNSLIKDRELVFRGPNTDILGSNYRHDNCHFNSKGLIKLSKLWYQSIFIKSEI